MAIHGGCTWEVAGIDIKGLPHSGRWIVGGIDSATDGQEDEWNRTDVNLKMETARYNQLSCFRSTTNILDRSFSAGIRVQGLISAIIFRLFLRFTGSVIEFLR